MPREQIGHLLRILGQKPFGPSFHSRQAEAGGLVEDPLCLHLVAPIRYLTHAPRDRGSCHPGRHPTSTSATGRCSASERSAAIAIRSASSASAAVHGLPASPLTR